MLRINDKLLELQRNGRRLTIKEQLEMLRLCIHMKKVTRLNGPAVQW